MFHAECQGASKEQLEEWLAKRNVTFPNTLGRGPFDGYQGEQGLPYAFVVGVEGDVIWQGRRGYKQVIHDEMKKVRYPGLGKAKVAKKLQEAAGLFAQGKFAKAAEKAESVMGKSEDDAEIATDGKHIVSKVAAMKAKLHAKVERYKKEREFAKALASLQKISAGFKGTPEGAAAKTSLKELRKDKTVRNELKAFATLESIQKKFGTMSDANKKRAMLEGFMKQYEGTKAAEHAKRQLSWL